MKAGWEPCNIGGICAVDWGNTNLTKSAYVEAGQHLAVSAAGCDGRIGHWEHKAGTPVLSAIGAQCGRMFFPDEDFTAIKNTITLTPKSGICDGKFLFHLLNHVTLPQRGAGQPFISKGDIQKFPVSIPPLDEQRRIVAVLDKAFAGIATATANAQKNLTNARALFEGYLESIFSQIDGSWEAGSLKKIGGNVSTGPFGSLLHKSDYVENGIPLVNPAHIIGERIEPDHRKSISAKTLNRLSAYVLAENDIVIGRRGEIGRCAVVTEAESGWLCGTGCFFIRPKISVNAHFLAHLLRSRPYRETLEAMATGATMLNLSNTALGELEIALPSLACQNDHVASLGEISAYVGKLQDLATAKLAALTELKQSLLHKAFAGELT